MDGQIGRTVLQLSEAVKVSIVPKIPFITTEVMLTFTPHIVTTWDVP